ncbi:MAG: hypothetical protein ACYDA3_06215 [Gaiellaceae bacterium]
MRPLRFLPALVLLALAGLAALLSADLRSWGRTMRSDDALVSIAPRDATFAPPLHIPYDTAERLLGLGDDVAFAKAIAQYRIASAVPIRLDNADQVAAVRSRAENALAEVARTTHDPRLASQAETLLGVMTFADLAQPVGVTGLAPTGIGRSQADAALANFSDAVRIDPDNVTAKYDLELLLRALLVQGTRVGPGNQAGASSGRRGAGGGQPGSGY